jgi:succinyl-CoA synthetase beta subunit
VATGGAFPVTNLIDLKQKLPAILKSEVAVLPPFKVLVGEGSKSIAELYLDTLMSYLEDSLQLP